MNNSFHYPTSNSSSFSPGLRLELNDMSAWEAGNGPTSLENFSLGSPEDAQEALNAIDQVLATVNVQRTEREPENLIREKMDRATPKTVFHEPIEQIAKRKAATHGHKIDDFLHATEVVAIVQLMVLRRVKEALVAHDYNTLNAALPQMAR